MTAQRKKKDIREMSPLMFGYCEIYYILQYYSRIGYTAGIYGRNEDIYYIDWEYITTGYRPTGESPKNIKNWLKLNEKIKNRDFSEPYEKRLKKVQRAVSKLIEGAR